ncbi:alpha/beta hydrolase family protein [Planomonospora parontospora]|uniref:alpha/beta hydrolase family protein n=1 Tax=Planomonospora parontospora TaxID=58119 RepID=UPI0016717DDA|nr:alpha/beta family hydrolase [Planomonospora parontospora]GGL29559.1 alpha/beta hydrolase [Planomonospora parontospora subsp. antibiotica]GII17805.1 alpha/beta hydrolase [Planomonospora parontospora subsp. antibiotica]
MEIVTPHGPARAEIDPVPDPRFLLVLTHGSAGGVDAPDLLAVRDAVLGIGGLVARVTQPFRLRGARAPGSAVKQDEAWAAAVAELRRSHPGLPMVQGGRSNGARVACRTAGAVGAEAVVALAFPLHPPGRPERSRAQELRAAGVDVLAVSGDRDPFGMPEAEDVARLVVLPGEGHDLKKDPARVGEAVAGWLDAGARTRR